MLQDIELKLGVSWRSIAAQKWVGSLVLALTVGVVYFSSARLGLALQRHGVAVFWPAAGISAGMLIVLGARARWPVAAGVIVANIAANLLGDRNLWSASVFSIADAGEAILAAAAIDYYFGERFELDRLSHVLGFVAAACAATAVSGLVGTLGYVLFHPSTASILIIWVEWFVSDGLGIVTVAPILIGLASTLRRLPRRRELVEGIVALGLLAGLSGLVVLDARGPWAMSAPLALSFPLLLWIGARCPPVFAAAASFIASTAINLTTTFGIGIFGDPVLPVDERIVAARAAVLAVTLCALVLTALFAERRRHELALANAAARLEEALTIGGMSAFTWDRRSGASHRSTNAARMLGFDPKQSVTPMQFLAHVHPDDRARFKDLLRGISPRQASYEIAFRFIRPDGRLVWLKEILEAEFDAAGRCQRLMGLTRDITETRRSDEVLRESEERLRLAVKAVQLAAWERNDRIGTHFWSDEYYRLFGYRVGEIAPSRAAWLARVHPEDREAAEARVRAAESARTDYQNEFRVVWPNGTTRWVRARGRYFSSGENGVRTIGLIEDVTEVRQHIERQHVMVAELQHRTRNLMAVVQSIAYQTLDTSKSLADFERRFDRRLEALSRVQSLLSRADTGAITIRALILMELEAIGAEAFGERIVARGPEVPLRKSAVEMLSLAIHELATNTIKYGALANPTGHLSVTWRVEAMPPERQLVLDWVEHAVSLQSGDGVQRRGYGRTLIEEALPFSLGAKTSFDLTGDTLHCRIGLPLTTDDTNEVAA